MVHPLYFVLDIVFAIVLIIILHHDHKIKPMVDSQEKAFRLLINWVIFFCLQDAVWGICASDFITSDLPLFIASSVFHFSTVLTTFFWLYYILKYLSDRILTNYRRLLLWIDILVIVLQIGLIVTNFYTPLIFEVVQGRYVPAYLRPLAFFNQYVVYLLISIITFIFVLASNGSRHDKYVSVFIFSLAPVLSGAFQLLYPDGPFYSVGYFLGCFIIHMYVVTQDRDTLKSLQAERKMKEQVKRSLEHIEVHLVVVCEKLLLRHRGIIPYLPR